MKRINFSLLVVGALLPGFFSSCSTSSKKEKEKSAKILKEENALPNMFIRMLDGTNLSAKSLLGSKTIFILFQPDCDHCQKEAKGIRDNVMAFKNYKVYFITAARIKEVEKFSNDFKFSDQKNFHFAMTDVQSIINSYGPIQAPSIYIYSATGKLLTQFNGETEMENILKAL